MRFVAYLPLSFVYFFALLNKAINLLYKALNLIRYRNKVFFKIGIVEVENTFGKLGKFS